jgi:nitrate reductase gamma subunit
MVLFAAGLVWRYRSRLTISSLSSQVLESRWLLWGSVPFHLGLFILFAGHLLPLIAPGLWQSWMANRPALLAVESVGVAAALLCLAGLIVLLARRIASHAVQRNSTVADIAVLVILIAQAAIGLGVATMHRWGALWSARTTTPYLWSILTFQPDPSLIAGAPPLLLFHLSAAWVVLALIPFTRLVHMMTLPLAYLGRPPQKVVWVSREPLADL